jgi:hypothetical protein
LFRYNLTGYVPFLLAFPLYVTLKDWPQAKGFKGHTEISHVEATTGGGPFTSTVKLSEALPQLPGLSQTRVYVCEAEAITLLESSGSTPTPSNVQVPTLEVLHPKTKGSPTLKVTGPSLITPFTSTCMSAELSSHLQTQASSVSLFLHDLPGPQP